MAIGPYDLSVVPCVWEPSTVEEAWELKQQFGLDGKFVAGGTWLRTQWEAKALDRPDHLIRLDTIPELQGVKCEDDQVSIGAFTILGELSKHGEVMKRVPLLFRAIQSIAAPSVRNMATLGGNILSKTGDCIPMLLVLESRLIWFDGENLVEESLEDWLLQMKEGKRIEDRILVRVHVPIEGKSEETSAIRRISFYEKIGRREAFTVSVVTIAFSAAISSNGVLSNCRMAAGGGSTLAMRLQKAEQVLNEREFSDRLLAEMHHIVMEEFVTSSDPFSSASYRRCTAANLLAAGIKKRVQLEKGEA